MSDKYKNLKEHLSSQIRTADKLGSKWAYILKEEAEKCLELAEAQDTLVCDPVDSELEGGGGVWWYVCGECHSSISQTDNYCRECGRRIRW